MSKKIKEETLPLIKTDLGQDTPPPAKRVAKKATAKKTAAKKTTSVRKVGTESETAIQEPIAAPAPKKKIARTKNPVAPAAQPEAAPPPLLPPVVSNEPTPRFGRVPGGGPVNREPAPNSPPHNPANNPPPVREIQSPYKPEEQSSPAGPPAQVPQPREGQQQQLQNRDGQNRDAQPQQFQNRDGQQREGRSKRRREKRKRRNNERQVQGPPQRNPNNEGPRPEPVEPRQIPLPGPKIEADGMLELAPKGFGFLRVANKGFEQARDDVFVTPESIRKFNLRIGQWIHGLYQEGPRGPQLVEITSINGMPPEEAAKLPHFEELKAINPTRRISFETTPERFTTRVVDIMAPVGRGQRGLIVSPPRSGKTTLLLHMAEAIREKYDEAIHLMVLLVDERPEEVTEFRRALPGAEIYASSNDEQPRNHCRIAELAIERAKRLVEAGKDVFLLMDSITRLARAYNNTMNNRGRGTGSGGITIGALEVPRRLFAAARNTRGGGSLTIMATALIQTNSRADEAIFMEFKGTGNMELVLDRKIAENYIYPAVDIFKSGTRREELLIPDHMLHKIHLIRRGLSGHRPVEAMERLLFFLKKFPNNPQMLLEIKG